MIVDVKNKMKKMRSFNLEAPYFLERNGGKPQSITFTSLEKKEGLPAEVLGCIEISNAIKNGTLRILRKY